MAEKSDENIIVERERSINTAEKDPSTTAVAHSVIATVVGSVNATEFWKRRTRPPSFLLLLSGKMYLAIPVVVVVIQKRLLLNIHIGYFSVVTSQFRLFDP